MRRILTVVAVLAVAAAWTMERPTPAASEDGIAVYFSSKGGTDAIIHEIGNARETVIVQAYSINSRSILVALLDAHKRGVSVHVVLDTHIRNLQGNSAKFLDDVCVPVVLDSQHLRVESVPGHIVIVIDVEMIITGTFAFSFAGKQREEPENLLIITGKPRLARGFQEAQGNLTIKTALATSLSSDRRGFMIFGPLAHTDSTEVTSNDGGSLDSCARLVVSGQSSLMAGTWGTMLRDSDSSAIDGRASLRR